MDKPSSWPFVSLEDRDSPVRALVVEDHQLSAEALAAVLHLETDADVACALNTDGLHEQLGGARYDVVVLDTRLPAPSSLEYIAGLRKKLNGAKVMLLPDEPRVAFQQEAVKEIVHAAVLKSMPLDGFLKVFELVLAGQKFVPPLPAGEEESVIDAETNVTREEQIVLSAAARGLTDKEIAVETNYPLNCVKHNLMRVRAKLKARDRTQAAIQARERGII